MTGRADVRSSSGTLFDAEDAALRSPSTVPANANAGSDQSDIVARLLSGQLPMATSTRWKPLRTGLINLYLFDNEVFPFADGRLLLRGDNGAGKSRVLALTLPLLLDGRLHATRVEPDRDASRQIAWNLLMDEHSDRTGYTWIEFGRVDEDGQPRFLTLGLGLRGVRGRGITDHWMFLTPQRVGDDLSLITADRRVVSRRLLSESLADQGQLFDSSSEYRRAVDEALFRLHDRYDALLDLLLQLRQPQLAKKLDLAGLEAALMEALPPISSTLLADAADAFRSLDQERETLANLEQARLAVREFLRPWRRHLRLGIYRAAGRLRRADAQLREATAALQEAEAGRRELEAACRQLETGCLNLINRQKSTTAALQTLRTDPATQHAEKLNTARQLVEAAEDRLQRAQSASQRSDREVAEAEAETQVCRRETDHLRRRAESLRDAAAATAVPGPLQRRHVELFRVLLPDTPATPSTGDSRIPESEELAEDLAGIETEVAKQVDHWRRTGQHLATLHQRVLVADAAFAEMVYREDDARERLQVAVDEAAEANDHRDATAERIWTEIENWLQSSDLLPSESRHDAGIRSEWNNWIIEPGGHSPVVRLAEVTLRKSLTESSRAEASLAAESEQLAARQDELNADLDRLQAADSDDNRTGRLSPVSETMDEGRAGWPFWHLIEFRQVVPREQRGGWEAALKASGLLHARVAADGQVSGDTSRDTFLAVADEQPVEDPTRRLSSVFEPAAGCVHHGAAVKLVSDILDRIGVGPESARLWVDVTGRWRNGPLTGSGEISDPRWIGRDARSQWRQQRIAELDAELARSVDEFVSIQKTRDSLRRRVQLAEEQYRRLPDDGPLRTAVARCHETSRQREEAEQRLAAVSDQAHSDRQLHEAAIAARDAAARDTGLIEWADRPDDLVQRLETYEDRLRQSLEAWNVYGTATIRLRRSEEQLLRRQNEQEASLAEFRAAEQEAQSRTAVCEELEQTLGVDAQEITRRIAEHEAELGRLEQESREATESLRQKERESARLEARMEMLEERRQTADQSRQHVAAGMAELADCGMLASADTRLADVVAAPESMEAAVELADRVEQLGWRVAAIDDEEAWSRSETSIYKALEPLKGRLSAYMMNVEPEFIGDHVCRVLIQHAGTHVSPDRLSATLESEIEEHESVLSENERVILEKHLLGDIAGELHERMRQAVELVGTMNREVSSRPMKTGMQMRFRWEPDPEGPSGLNAACRLLNAGVATWSAEDRRLLGDFLRDQIRRGRESEEAIGRLEQLSFALDYRRWHRLRIDRRSAADQDWKLLTRKTYGSGSGGEKAIALTLPQVAAAAAYYRTADPLAPRLILLDEAFAGISTNNRAACMELLTAFELDVVMTSESEWGCYATVPQLAICQLTRMPDLAAIDNTVFVWNGKERLLPE